MIGKAEVLARGANSRFVVTSLSPAEAPARELYEAVYCGRGDMEIATMAIRLSGAFGGSPESWLTQQMQHDLWHARQNREDTPIRRFAAA